MAVELIRVEKRQPTFAEARSLTGEGFGRELGAADGVVLARVLANNPLGFVAIDDRTKEAIGYGVFREHLNQSGGDVLHIGSLMTSRRYRGGIGGAILDAAIASGEHDLLSFHTASPFMHAVGARRVEVLYPRLDGRPTPLDIEQTGRALVSDPDQYPVWHGLYQDGPLYAERPRLPDAHADEAFASFPGFNYHAGDAIMFMGRIARES